MQPNETIKTFFHPVHRIKPVKFDQNPSENDDTLLWTLD